MGDQAEQLRRLMGKFEQHQGRKTPIGAPRVVGGPRVIVVASGKGGVGKTNFCVNFAIGLHTVGHRCVILDADVGFANVEVLLGVRPSHNLTDVLAGMSIWEAVESHPSGISFLSGGLGLMDIHSMSEADVQRLVTEMKKLHEQFDFVLVDCGGGLGENTARMISSADDLILITTPEPTAIADAYAVMKLLGTKGELPRTHLVVNRIRNIADGRMAAEKLRLVCERFLGVKLHVMGYMFEDPAVNKAVMGQQALLDTYPKSPASQSIHQLVKNFLRIESPRDGHGLTGFLNRLFSRRKSGGSAG
jgi:flagellar biosynthesis protein FlhG